jgi:hypothetical protein
MVTPGMGRRSVDAVTFPLNTLLWSCAVTDAVHSTTNAKAIDRNFLIAGNKRLEIICLNCPEARMLLGRKEEVNLAPYEFSLNKSSEKDSKKRSENGFITSLQANY